MVLLVVARLIVKVEVSAPLVVFVESQPGARFTVCDAAPTVRFGVFV